MENKTIKTRKRTPKPSPNSTRNKIAVPEGDSGRARNGNIPTNAADSSGGEAAAIWAPIDRIYPWENNPRKNNSAVASVMKSIETFGFASPIVARKATGEIIAGHTRYWAARELGLTTVPVRFLDVTEDQASALALADNKLGEIADWDEDKLKALLAECDPDTAYIAGWSDSELEALLDHPTIEVLSGDDSQPSNNPLPSDDEDDLPLDTTRSDDPDIACKDGFSKAPFPWFGGKSRAANAIWRHLGPDVDNYIEPFCGSAGVLLRRPGEYANNHGKLETINDLDGHICNVWRSIALDPEATAHHATWPVSEADLHARHVALLRWKESEPYARLMGDPNFCDPKVAGWWIWASCCSIRPVCTDNGPWTDIDGKLAKKGEASQPGISKSLPQLASPGRGVLNAASRASADNTLAWLQHLSRRLANVRIAHGDWSRCVTKTIREASEHSSVKRTCGVFLDPPYDDSVHNAPYSVNTESVAKDCRDWCLEHGNDPQTRIVLAGYSGEGHEELRSKGWRERKWFRPGNFNGRGTQSHKERLWLSPHCLP